MRSAPHFLALALAVFLLGCCSANTEPRTAQPVASSSAASSSEAEAAVPRRAFFSGEIVYRQTAVPRSEGGEPVDLGDLHYFISGPHWKHVDANGQTLALYDSVANVVHYYAPERKTVDASRADESARFEELPDTKLVLGRVCKSFRQVSSTKSFTFFYDPELVVDPELFTNHAAGHWNEFLSFTGGGLSLWSRTELPGVDIISEAILIRPATFEPSFWEPN